MTTGDEKLRAMIDRHLDPDNDPSALPPSVSQDQQAYDDYCDFHEWEIEKGYRDANKAKSEKGEDMTKTKMIQERIEVINQELENIDASCAHLPGVNIEAGRALLEKERRVLVDSQKENEQEEKGEIRQCHS